MRLQTLRIIRTKLLYFLKLLNKVSLRRLTAVYRILINIPLLAKFFRDVDDDDVPLGFHCSQKHFKMNEFFTTLCLSSVIKSENKKEIQARSRYNDKEIVIIVLIYMYIYKRIFRFTKFFNSSSTKNSKCQVVGLLRTFKEKNNKRMYTLTTAILVAR